MARRTRRAGARPRPRPPARRARHFRRRRARALLDAALTAPVEGHLLSLVAAGAATTVTFAAEPWDGGAMLLGQLASAHVAQLATELDESHRGVRSLHAELDDRTDSLRMSAEVNSRMLANASHELRTPLHSILGLTQLLLDGVDGALGAEQRKQVQYVRASAEELIQIVDDLLDLGKLDAGKLSLRLERFALDDFLGSMRGMLRPLIATDLPVQLVFEQLDCDAAAELETDRTKLAQIVRNLVSNAIKFTERGEVRVTARIEADDLILEVRDTGIGIASKDLDRIFEEFGQIESHLQQRIKGSGLGLPLSKRLAELLGGRIDVQSQPGVGSTFTLRVPTCHADAREMNALVARSRRTPPGPGSILVVEDDRKTLFVYEKFLVMSGFHVLPARTVDEARALLRETRPAAIVLDVMLEGEASWHFLAALKRDPATSDIPVLVVTVTNREQKARALGADEFWLKPVDQEKLLRRLKQLARTSVTGRVLVIDDDERARYLIRRHLEGTPYTLLEAASGPEGLRTAQEHLPHVILLDFLLRDVTAFDVLDELKADPRTRGIPVIIITSHLLAETDRVRLLAEAEAIISKQNLSRELAINRIRDALHKVGVTRARRALP